MNVKLTVLCVCVVSLAGCLLTTSFSDYITTIPDGSVEAASDTTAFDSPTSESGEPDFSFSVTPQSVVIDPNNNVTVSASIVRLSGFSDSVDVTISGSADLSGAANIPVN